MTNHSIELVIDDAQARRDIALFEMQMARLGTGASAAALNNLSSQFNRASQAARNAGNGLNGASNSSAAASAAFNNLSGSIGRVGKVAVLAGGAMGALAGGLLVHKAIEATKNYQSLNAQLVVATGSTEAASAAFRRLQSFAAKTPFSLNQSVEGFIKLKNLGLDPSERSMMSFGNTAASMGKGMMDMVEAVADASTGEFERLKEFGIKSQTEGNKVKFTFAGVTTSVGKNATDIQKYLVELGENKFGSAMALQAGTLDGVINNLGDTFDQLLVRFGSGFAPAMMGAISALSDGSQSLDQFAVSAGQLTGGAISSLVTGMTFVAQNADKLALGLAVLSGPVMANVITAFGTKAVVALTAFSNAAKLAAFQGAMAASMAGTTGAALRLSSAMGVLRAAGSGVSAMFGGPLGLALAAAAAAFVYFKQKSDEAKFSIDRAAEAAGEGGALYRQLHDEAVNTVRTQDQLRIASIQAGAGMNEATGKAARLTAELQKLGITAQWAAQQQAAADAKTAKSDFLKVQSKRAGAEQQRDQIARAGGSSGDTFDIVSLKQQERDAKQRLREATATLNAANRELEAGLKGPPKVDVPASAASVSSGPKKDRGSKTDQATQRLKAEQEFFENLKQEAIIAGKTTAEAEEYNKQLELRKILNDGALAGAKGLSTAQEQQIKNSLTLRREAEFQKAINDQIKVSREDIGKLDRQILGLASSSSEKAAEQLRIDEKIAAIKKDALEKAIPLTSTLVQNAINEAEAIERGVIAREKQIAAMQRAIEFEKGFKEKNDPIAAAATLRDQRIDDAAVLRANERFAQINGDGLDASEATEIDKRYQKIVEEAGKSFNESVDEAGQAFRDSVSGAFDKIGGQIGGKLGGIFGKAGGVLGDLMKSTDGTKFGEQLKSVFGPDTKFMKTLGKMGDGAETGAKIAELAKSLGFKKFSTTGSKIGGAIGSMVPIPGGEIIGSIIGGTIGGLMKKPKKGSATLGFNADGELSVSSLTGNSSKMKGAANDAAGAVISGLMDIANRLGADLGGTPSVSIGLRDGKFRVDPTGKGATKVKSGAVDFGKDGGEAAVRFAIQDAIKDGVLIGLSSFSERILKSGKNLDSAVSLAESYEKVIDRLAAVDDPLKAAFSSVSDNYNRLLEQMRKAGATTAEMANVERARSLDLNEAFEDQVSGFKDFQKAMMGEAGGVTELNRLNRSLGDFNAFKLDIAAGKAVDQDKFTALGQEILGLSGSVFGATTERGQEIIRMLMDTTKGAIDNVQDAMDNTTVVAIKQSEDVRSQQHAVTNDLLRQIIDKLGIDPAMAGNFNLSVAQALAAARAVGGGGGGSGTAGRQRQV